MAERRAHDALHHVQRQEAEHGHQRVIDPVVVQVQRAQRAALEATEARASGMRYFRIRTADEVVGAGEFVCPASAEGGMRKLCTTCGACNGTTKATGASPVIIVHGNKASRFTTQRAAQ
jgi:hypothetical protein